LKEQNHIRVITLLDQTPKHIVNYLNSVLPLLGNNWWNKFVISKLTYMQQNRLKGLEINSLTSLDLAALLRVLDQNWYQISTKMDLSSEARNFVKEMMAVRDRWAHKRAKGLLFDDMYRDIDTLERFATVIKADTKFIEDIRKTKKILIVSNGVDDSNDDDNDDDKRKFKTNYNRKRVEDLCNVLIKGGRGVTLGKYVLKQLDQGYLNRSTYEMLSKWVNPKRAEYFAQPIAAEISEILFGEKIKRISQ